MYILAYGDAGDWNMNEKDEEGEHATQCDKNRTPLEKCFITLIIILTSSICVLAAIIIIVSLKAECKTAECIKQSAWIQNAVSRKTNPCDDFYQYVCDTTKNVDGAKQTAKRLKTIVEEQVKNVMLETLMLQEDVLVRALKKMFRACLDVKNKQKHLEEAYRAVVEWGLLKYESKNFNWLEFLKLIREHGLGYDLFFDVSVIDNVSGSDEQVLRIGPPNSPIINTKQSKDEEMFLSVLTEITKDNRNSYTKELTTMKHFEETYDFSPSILLPNTTAMNISENTTVLVMDPYYLSKLVALIDETEERGIVETYMQRHILKTIVNEYIEWVEREDQESYCAKKTEQLLPHFTKLAYIRKHFTKEKQDEAKIIALEIKSELLTILEKAEWLDEKTKNYILAKIGTIGFIIGAPDDFLNRDLEFSEEASSIADDENFLLMILKAKKYSYYRKFSVFEEDQVVFRELTSAILSVYPFYSFKHNLIVLPAAVLQNPIFHLDRPKYLNYGLLGAIIGRELMRAFVGFAKDSVEECLDVDWSLTLKQVQCLKEQYSSYNYSDVPVDGTLKGDEIFADIAGTKLAYLAYHNRIELHDLDRPLFGLNFTAEQMFWVVKGLHACHFLETFWANNPAPSYMVMSPFMNLEAFSDDFECYRNKFVDVDKCDVL